MGTTSSSGLWTVRPDAVSERRREDRPVPRPTARCVGGIRSGRAPGSRRCDPVSCTPCSRPRRMRMISVQIGHDRVAFHLGDHAGRRHRRAAPVRLDDRDDPGNPALGPRDDLEQRSDGADNQSWDPSRSTRSTGSTAAKARSAARRSAAVRPNESISPAVACPTADSAVQRGTRGPSRSRAAGVSSLESRSPVGAVRVRAMMTATPTLTGPATAPRPTSSMPATE